MANDKRTKGGRVTPKGPPASGRYTPPIPKAVKSSPPWVPVLIGILLGVGSLVIILNYLDVLPNGVQNYYLIVGLVMITAGFITATQWH